MTPATHHDVVLCYNNDDKEINKHLDEALGNFGIDCWADYMSAR